MNRLRLNCLKKNWSYGSGGYVDEDFEFEQRTKGEVPDVFLDPTLNLGRDEEVLSRLEIGEGRKEKDPSGDASVSSSLDVLELKREENAEGIVGSGGEEKSDLVPREDRQTPDAESDDGDFVERSGKWKKQVMRRSSMLAKQVISMQSALSLGFISQLWVDTISWVVLLVEVRPSMLSGEMERFFLQDVCKVRDVVLVRDESVLENEFIMIVLDTLVGYNVVTPDQHIVGKVRGYTFDLNSGRIELLELDSIGISIIPASLVSTYGLPIDDVMDVTSDTVVVHEDSPSHVQRLSKGLWHIRNEPREHRDHSQQLMRSVRRQRDHDQYFPGKMRNSETDWELPMDY